MIYCEAVSKLKASVVVATKNRPIELRTCLEALVDQTCADDAIPPKNWVETFTGDSFIRAGISSDQRSSAIAAAFPSGFARTPV